MRIKTYELPSRQTLYYTGPDMAWGAVPSVFYFSISGRDSLLLDPFNQPAAFLAKFPIRVCSLNLPHHESNEDPHQAIAHWASDLLQGRNCIEEFLQKTLQDLLYLKSQGFIDHKLAMAGLSRGAFFAAHLTALFPDVKYLLGFAPLTRLKVTKEFSALAELYPKIDRLDLHHLKSQLCNRTIRCYIGNHDTRVGTRECFEFLEALSHQAFEQRERDASIEMIMGASIGHHGHGTAPETFTEGAIWLAKKLGIKDEALSL